MRSITPIDAALELIDTLEGKPDRTDVEDWLLAGLKRYRAGYVKTLDDSLGLSVGQGQAREKLCYVWRTRERNQLIREAAGNLVPDYGKVTAAKLIACAMNTAIPDLFTLKRNETVRTLCKLRQICMNHRGDSPLALGWRRTLEIMNGDGC
ncbi:hypothetical protein [Marinobacter sp.]|uniref:hypothetical protein n=1 Tax=Marinobacter sp. TaxID=50741 RepID=UPI0035C684C3